jgi:hypothetical protein
MPEPKTRFISPTSALLTAGLLLFTLAQCGEASPPGNAQDGSQASSTAEPPKQPAVVGERIRLLLSGSMEGRLEPCGCASGQLGGLARRMMHVQELRNYDLLLEGGDMVQGNTPLDVAKAETSLQVLFMMPELTALLRGLENDPSLVGPYHALGIGPRDLALPMDLYWGGLPSALDMPLLAADLTSTQGGWPARAFVDYEVRGTKVRITSLAMQLPDEIRSANPPPLQLLDPAAAWQRAMQGSPADLRKVVMVHARPKEAHRLAETLDPKPDLLVCIDDTHNEPPAAAEIVADVPIVYPGIRGRVMLSVTLARTEDGLGAVTGYEPVPLRGSETRPGAGQDPTVRQIILSHRDYVAETDIQEAMAETLPVPGGHSYVGSKKCGDCHPQAFESWQNSKHARAWETLVHAEKDPSRYGWPVTEYPDCISCHVVGFRQKSGFVTHAATPELAGVGCERCHGPGSAHVQNPVGAKMGKVGDGLPSKVCTECHDFEQSPDFDYGRRWPIIEHGK